MIILRLSTFSLILAVAVFTLGHVNSSFAAPKTCAEKPRPSCDGDTGGETTIGCATCVYRASLTGTKAGAFEFASEIVIPDSTEHELQFVMDPVVTPHGDANTEGAWQRVFNQCDALLGPTNVPTLADFTVESYIDKSGGVSVVFRDIQMFATDNGDELALTLVLKGTTPHDEPFLPERPTYRDVDTIIDHHLTLFNLYGTTVSGVHPRRACHKKKGAPEINSLDNSTWSTLRITSTDPTLLPRP